MFPYFYSIEQFNFIFDFREMQSLAKNVHKFSWQQTMLRIKDPKLSVPFYERNFGFTLIHT